MTYNSLETLYVRVCQLFPTRISLRSYVTGMTSAGFHRRFIPLTVIQWKWYSQEHDLNESRLQASWNQALISERPPQVLWCPLLKAPSQLGPVHLETAAWWLSLSLLVQNWLQLLVLSTSWRWHLSRQRPHLLINLPKVPIWALSTIEASWDSLHHAIPL